MKVDDIRLSGFSSAGLDRALLEALAVLDGEKAVARVWAKDPTLWKERDEEISNRLGWLDAAEGADAGAPARDELVRALRTEGFRRAVVLGMGGSSLAPEVFARVYGPDADGLPVDVLDSTDPGSVARLRSDLPIDRTLFVVSSKSGSTLETASFLSYFWNEVAAAVGPRKTGLSFVAVTDPGTSMARLAERLSFRAVFPGDPDVGGRFSALTAFGLVPAALMGADTAALLASGRAAAQACRTPEAGRNPGAYLGAILATAAAQGMDKLALLLPPRMASLGAWIEQLVAESTGKEGRGILPLAGRVPDDEAGIGGLLAGGRDILPIFFEWAGDGAWTEAKARRIASGRPCLSIRTEGPAGLGGLMFLWEFATAVAGRLLGVNPFDQPDVASSKKKTTESLDLAIKDGRIPMEPPTARDERASVWAEPAAADAADAVRRLAGAVPDDGYAVFQAFLPARDDVREALKDLALRFQARSGRPTAFDFGPRFLHSTGQLHKGDRGRGVFVQITADHPVDAAVPESPGGRGSSYTFGTLVDAQAAGDRQALLERGRRVVAVRLHADPAEGLKALASAL